VPMNLRRRGDMSNNTHVTASDSEAIQFPYCDILDCFVALLLAMTRLRGQGAALYGPRACDK
jgi:hypothetical protein